MLKKVYYIFKLKYEVKRRREKYMGEKVKEEKKSKSSNIVVTVLLCIIAVFIAFAVLLCI